MGSINWGSVSWGTFAFGVVMVAAGITCFFSTALQRWAMDNTGQGLTWAKLVGEKRAPYVVKYLSSVGFFVYAGFIFYDALYGH